MGRHTFHTGSGDDASGAALVARCVAGDRTAFRLLVETYQPFAYALAFRLLRDPDGAADVVQESFIRVWKNLETYRPESRFTTWLYRIVVNLGYDAMRRERRFGRLFDRAGRGEDPGVTAENADPARRLEVKDLAERVLQTAAFLPPKQRMVFTLRDVQDMTLEEIADTTGMSIGTVKTNLSYARKRIRETLNRLEGTDARA